MAEMKHMAEMNMNSGTNISALYQPDGRSRGECGGAARRGDWLELAQRLRDMPITVMQDIFRQ
jgi:hypothetical protein